MASKCSVLSQKISGKMNLIPTNYSCVILTTKMKWNWMRKWKVSLWTFGIILYVWNDEANNSWWNEACRVRLSNRANFWISQQSLMASYLLLQKKKNLSSITYKENKSNNLVRITCVCWTISLSKSFVDNRNPENET